MNKFCWLTGQFLFVAAASAQMIYGPTDDPKDYPKALAREEVWVAQHPAYGFTYVHHESPENLVAIGESANSQNNPVERLHNLLQAAKAALEIGHNEQAGKFAEESLRVMEEYRQHLGFLVGYTIFNANLVLGRLALSNNSIPEAEKFLLLAGRTSGSPDLNSFGPNMSLARELLKQGRRDAVLQFFTECKVFWKDRRLDAWITQVQNGELPVFGANLRY